MSKLEAIEEYNNHPAICKHCGGDVVLRDGERPNQARRKKYCSQSCAATSNNTGKIKVPRSKCSYCG